MQVALSVAHCVIDTCAAPQGAACLFGKVWCTVHLLSFSKFCQSDFLKGLFGSIDWHLRIATQYFSDGGYEAAESLEMYQILE